MNSRWPTRILCAGLALWYARFGLARRRPPASPRRILIAHSLLLGDTIMLAPLLKKLRTRFPQAEIVMTCKRAFLPLFASRPYGVQAMPFDPRDTGSFFALLCERGFDLALLPADNRLSWLARGLDSRWIVAFEGDHPAYKNWLVDEFRHFPDHAMALGDLFAEFLVDGPAPLPYEKTDWPAPPAESFPLPPAPYCVLHVGASTRLRYWEPEKWRSLIARLEASGITPVITAGPGEEALVAQIDPEKRCISYPGRLSLPQMWGLLAGASAVVCPDTGVGHLARLAGAPAVVLFGPGSATLFSGGEFWRNTPDRKVTIPKFFCRDENLLFRRYLPWAEHCGRTTAQCASPKCMHALTADMAIDALESLLAETGKRMTSA
ncbi:MAG: glycosyltransferase family 9 protein [Betaproteobacteria bacterium]|nr:glycosyltransferase family 9 protein [Betaproteobacteria bacterium]